MQRDIAVDLLYDLMTMAVKYQVSLCLRPYDLLLITFNHMDAILTYVKENSQTRANVDFVVKLLVQTYATLSSGELQLVRHNLMQFFQDMHTRVSIFLKEKVQTSNGRFILPLSGPVPYGTEIPGTVRYFNSDGRQIKSVEFPVSGKYSATLNEGSLGVRGDRVTKLGTNMYSKVRPSDTTVSTETQQKKAQSVEQVTANPNPMVKAELNLLAHLMGAVESKGESKKESDIRISMFNTEEEEKEFAALRPPSDMYDLNVIKIDATKPAQQHEANSKVKVNSIFLTRYHIMQLGV
ncbi:hypothetical protein BSL78_12827 [Apostichopus japonicus]|uniref:Protein OSCP1 n=1 Tax=Stichopus japonicus TaxID=307972 RepID=A0A2G8KQM3_STIJA|nr:hypothetical protein BSL78_12827 [Apostichopus japonicus]